MKAFSDLLGEIRRRAGEPLALATVVAVEGHAYRRPGARMLLGAEGPILGSVSGGCLEGEVRARAREVLASGRPQVLTFDLRTDLDLIWGSGSGCDGAATLLVEAVDPGAPWLAQAASALAGRRTLHLATGYGPASAGFHAAWEGEAPPLPGKVLVEALEPPIALWAFGAGDDAPPLVRLAKGLGWTVGVADHRPAFARTERFPEADHVRPGHPRQVIPGLALDRRTACVLLAHHYLKDQEALALLLPSEAGYLGLMGHRDRGARMLAELEADGLALTRAQRERFYTPVGLDLGGGTPEAVALAVLAEVQAHFARASALPLREGRGAIHAPVR
jgi:xanthine/CO dehydrogenase XdhC/CoxF family maturation factor